MPRNRRAVEKRATLRKKDEVVVMKYEGALTQVCTVPVLRRLSRRAAQCVDCDFREVDSAACALGLRRKYGELALVVRSEGASHLQPALLQVDVPPSERTYLAEPHSCRHGEHVQGLVLFTPGGIE